MKSPIFLSAFAIGAQLHAAVISINFNRNNDEVFASNVSAGAVAVTNWNQMAPQGTPSGTDVALVDDSGAGTTATVTYSANGTWAQGGANTSDGNISLLKGYLDDSNGAAIAVVTLNNIPYAQYDVYVYGIGDSDPGDLLNQYTLNDGNGDINFSYLRGANLSAGQTPVEASPSVEGHYFRINGLASSSFTLNNDNNRGDGRSPIAGIQIVQIPEPSTHLTFLAASLLLLRRKR
ncbi:hypothetical protein [Rubritalea tangerina]|uniref:PEP-CTERM sorting domain-containing protein n=1 Tax=Rubritalea tangerina TaxID=430798 RepID=A0ABW4Z781_9BACT